MKKKCLINLLIFLFGAMLLVPGAVAQEGAPTAVPNTSASIRLQQVDTTKFPDVTLTLMAADAQQPLPDSLPDLELAEAGEAITEFELVTVPAGIDLIFVVDANETIVEQDNDSELTRLEKVQRSIIRFSTQFMQPEGLDRVSVLVPSGTSGSGRFLVQNASAPGEVVNSVVAFAPESIGPVPLQAMMEQAIDHAAATRTENGRFQAILLFSDGALLNEQLDFDSLSAAAAQVNLPLFAAILGARADPNEIANVSRLADPSGGTYLHMPEPEAADPIFQLWQDLGQQILITFRSAQRSSGQYALTVVQGDTLLTSSYEVTLLPPVVSLLLEPGAVVRSGESPDTPLAELEPRSLRVPVAVAWPDGLPRNLSAVSLLVNDETVQTSADPAPDQAGGLLLDWDLTVARAGSYKLAVRVIDELELATESATVVVELLEDRPLEPLPTAAPTAAAVSPTTVLVETAVDNSALVGMAAALLLLIILLLLWQRRRSSRSERVDMSNEIADLIVSQRAAGSSGSGIDDRTPRDMVAFLDWLDETRDPIRLEAETTTLGREAGAADVVIDDESVSRLHARIKRSGDSYWLYDEGSAAGTYLNFDRLGLGPRILHDQNRVRIGQARFLFRLVPVIDEYSVSSDVPAAQPPAADEDWDAA